MSVYVPIFSVRTFPSLFISSFISLSFCFISLLDIYFTQEQASQRIEFRNIHETYFFHSTQSTISTDISFWYVYYLSLPFFFILQNYVASQMWKRQMITIGWKPDKYELKWVYKFIFLLLLFYQTFTKML